MTKIESAAMSCLAVSNFEPTSLFMFRDPTLRGRRALDTTFEALIRLYSCRLWTS